MSCRGYKDSELVRGQGRQGFTRPSWVIPKDTIEEGDIVGNQGWIRKCEKFRVLGDDKVLIHFKVEYKRRSIYENMFDGVISEMGENGDWTAHSKLDKLRDVLVKAKDVLEMLYGIEEPDPDVPLPEVSKWEDERRFIELPAMPHYQGGDWVDDDFYALYYLDDPYGDYAEDYDASTYDIEEVTGHWPGGDSDSEDEYTSDEDKEPTSSEIGTSSDDEPKQEQTSEEEESASPNHIEPANDPGKEYDAEEGLASPSPPASVSAANGLADTITRA